MTPQELTQREEQLFESLENMPGDTTFKGVLYRDGVPRPDVYLEQPVRVVFVFREPNLSGNPRAVDMRAEVRDDEFRPSRDGRLGEPALIHSWWNDKVGAYGHAVVHALKGLPPSFAKFRALIHSGQRSHEFLFPFGFMQVKKVGGGGSSKPREIRDHARKYSEFLKEQVTLYEPDFIIGCGTDACVVRSSTTGRPVPSTSTAPGYPEAIRKELDEEGRATQVAVPVGPPDGMRRVTSAVTDILEIADSHDAMEVPRHDRCTSY